MFRKIRKSNKFFKDDIILHPAELLNETYEGIWAFIMQLKFLKNQNHVDPL